MVTLDCMLEVIYAYRYSYLDLQLRHSDEGLIEVLDSVLGVLWRFEADISYPSVGYKLGICDRISL